MSTEITDTALPVSETAADKKASETTTANGTDKPSEAAASANSDQTPAATGIDKGRFSLEETGQVWWQKDSSNPTPGHAVATLSKGEGMFVPMITAIDGADYRDSAALQADLSAWMASHVDDVLGGICRFADADGVSAPLKDIAQSLKENGGVVDRYKVEKSLSELDPDMRRILRQHKIRSGPLLVFYQNLLKPAPLKLKSILWAIYNERELPLTRPKDGIVSEVLTQDRIDYTYYKMLGYPVFAKRAIRIDMLDRVVTDIYDQADSGMFRAQHKYAEWLGCSLDALYAVLEALGHYKMVEDSDAETVSPAAEGNVVTTLAVAPAVDIPVVETATEATDTTDVKSEVVKEEAVTAEPKAEEKATTPAADVKEAPSAEKPVLAQFKLKKGKLSTAPRRQNEGYKKTNDQKDDRKAYDPNKADQKKGNSFKKGNAAKNRKAAPRKDHGPRVITAEANSKNEEDSPFAILKNLNLK